MTSSLLETGTESPRSKESSCDNNFVSSQTEMSMLKVSTDGSAFLMLETFGEMNSARKAGHEYLVFVNSNEKSLPYRESLILARPLVDNVNFV